MGKTLFDKIWDAHVLADDGKGRNLIYIDRLLVHENSFHAFDKLRRKGRTVRRPDKVFGFADHYVPTNLQRRIDDPENSSVIDILARNCAEYGITHFGLDNPDQGILHVVGPELGITPPGGTLAGADSHTSTHGAFGCYAFGIGASDAEHILATQTLSLKRPRTMRVNFKGTPRPGVEPKDLILRLIGEIGYSGGIGNVLEYAGEAIEQMSMEGRMTICNMSIEAGARAGLVGVDDTTVAYARGRRYSPDPSDTKREAEWRTFHTDADAVFGSEITIDCEGMVPMVTWGTSPEDVAPVTAVIPDPESFPEPSRQRLIGALKYMGLTPGMAISDIAVDKVFIGTCTNGRIEDLRRAAKILDGRTVKVPTLIVPGSLAVMRQAEQEGLHEIFKRSGAEWLLAGCSLCAGTNGDLLRPGERSASTSNRNFQGRQGRGARTHLVSAGMAATAALEGRIVDVSDTTGGDI